MKKSLWGLVLERAIVVMAKIFLQINYIWRHLKDILNVCWKLASGLWRKEGSFPKEPRWLERWRNIWYKLQPGSATLLSLSLSSLIYGTALLHCTKLSEQLQRCADVLLSYSTQGTPVVFCKMQSTRRTKRHMPSLDSLHHQKQHHQQHQHQHHQPAFVEFSRKSSHVMQM